MKRKINSLYTLIVALISLCIVSCSEDYSSPLKDLTVNDQTFETGTNSKTITLGTKDLSKCVVSSNANWCSATIQTSSVVINVQPNDTYEERQAVLTLTDPEDATTLSFKVIQKQNDAILVDKSNYTIPEEGGEITIKVQSNISYIVEMPVEATWLTKDEALTRSLSESSIKLKASYNNSGDERSAIVKLRNTTTGTITEFSVTQTLTPVVKVDKNQFELDHTGGELEFSVTSNIPLTVTTFDDWIVLGNPTYTDIYSFTMKVKINEMPKNMTYRVQNIIISDKANKWNLKKVITVEQTSRLRILDDKIEIYEGDTYSVRLSNNVGALYYIWKSSDPSVATVDNNGNVYGVSEGTATISVTSHNNYSDEIDVTVKYYDVESYITGSTSSGYTMVSSSQGSFAGYYVSCTLENRGTRNVTVNKCSIYENDVYIGSRTNIGTLKPGKDVYVDATNSYINITTRSFKFVWEYTYNGKKYTYNVYYN